MNGTKRTGRLAALGLIASTVALGGALVPAGPAHAASTARNGVCDSGEFCYYFNSHQAGSVSDFTSSVSDYGTKEPSCYDFRGAGAGKGKCVKNQAASVWNRTSQPVTVYYNSNYSGASQTIAAGAKAQLTGSLYNQNASHRIGAAAPTTPVKNGAISTPGNDYPWPHNATGVDPWAFYKGECVSFAAWRVRGVLGIKDFQNNWHGAHFGNANEWPAAARKLGYKVDTHPTPGSIAVRTSGANGHVAFVKQVNANGSFVVEEYNHVAHHAFSVRTATIGTTSNQFNLFIHFKG